MISLSIADGIAEIVLDAPHKLNSLDEQALSGFVPGVRRRRCRRLARRGAGAAAPGRGPRLLRGPGHRRRHAGDRRRPGLPGRAPAAAAEEDDRLPGPHVRGGPGRLPGRGAGPAAGHGRGVRGGERQVRLPVRQPGRHARFRRALVLHRAARHAPDAGPDLHGRADERRGRRGAGDVQPGHAGGGTAGEHPGHRGQGGHRRHERVQRQQGPRGAHPGPAAGPLGVHGRGERRAGPALQDRGLLRGIPGVPGEAQRRFSRASSAGPGYRGQVVPVLVFANHSDFGCACKVRL